MGGRGGIIGSLVLKDVQSKITKCTRKLELQPSISDSYIDQQGSNFCFVLF